MGNERKLEDIVMMDAHWSQVTTDMLSGQQEVKDLVAAHSIFIADRVILEPTDSRVLHPQVVLNLARQYGALDRQAVEIAGGKIENFRTSDDETDYVEASARRLVHHIHREAYGQIKSQSLRYIYRRHYLRRINALSLPSDAVH